MWSIRSLSLLRRCSHGRTAQRRHADAVRRPAEPGEGHLHFPVDAALDCVAARRGPQLHRHHGRIGQTPGRIIEQTRSRRTGHQLVAARKTPAVMAALMAEHDIVVMPSNSQYWHETFGIVSIEAQHAGCRVVASDDGGLPETDCGGFILVAPDNAEALAWGIREAITAGPMPTNERRSAASRFTVAQSVDGLMRGARPATSAHARCRRPGAGGAGLAARQGSAFAPASG